MEEGNDVGEAQQRSFDAAFVLAKFRSNSQFERYTESLMENMLQMCSFQVSQTDSEGFMFRTENSDFHKEHNSIVLKMMNSGSVSSNKNDTSLSFKATESQKDSPSSIQHTFTNSNEEGLYVLFYQVCVFPPIANTSAAEALKLLQQYTVSGTFELDITLTNMYKGQISYLTAGELPLPKMYLLFGLAYAVLVVVWYRLLRSKKHTFYIHHIMALLLLLKIATLVSESAKYHFVRIYGHSMFWSTLYNLLAFLKGIVLFTTILLIGSGWSFVKPFLNEREKKIIFLVLILQILDNIVLLILQLETEGERLYEDWKGLLHLIDILCCCAALLPIIWQVSILEKSADGGSHLSNDGDGEDDEEELILQDDDRKEESSKEVEERPLANSRVGESPHSHSMLTADQQRAIIKLKLFRNFYLIVITYIYITRVVVYLVGGWVGFKYSWVGSFLNEWATLLFYAASGYIFQPRDEIIYVELSNEGDDHYNHRRHELEDEEEEFVNGRGVKTRQHHRSFVELT